MDLRQIKAFCAVCDEGSINKAAQRLNISQPSVSLAIKALEAELNLTLFERHTTGAVATPRAHVLYQRFTKILRELDETRLVARGERAQQSGPLRIGVLPIIARGVFPQFLPQFLEKNSELQVRIAEGLPQRLTALLLSSEIDLAVVTSPPTDSRLLSTPLASEPFMLIGSTGNPEIPAGHVDLRTLGPVNLVLSRERNSLRHTIERYISLHELPFVQTVELENIYSTLDLVRVSDWVTLCPVSALNGAYEQYRIAQVTQPAMRAEYFLISRSNTLPSAMALEFIEEIKAGLVRNLASWERWRTTIALRG